MDLLLAIENQKIELVKYLIFQGIRYLTPFTTPLHLAIDKGDLEMLELLLEAGLDANEMKPDGSTPLYLAIYYGSFYIVEKLIEKGANVNIVNVKGKTPLDKALEIPLIRYGNDTNESFFSITVNDIDLAIMAALLGAGARVDMKQDNGKTVLHQPVAWSCVKVTQLLLYYGASVNEQDCDGNTPLHYALTQAVTDLNLGVVEVLVANGAKCDIKNNLGFTPLDYALKEHNDDLVKALTLFGKVDYLSKFIHAYDRYYI